MFVGLGNESACLATKLRLRDAILRCCVPAGFAAVRGVSGVDLNPDAPSIFRFGAQNRKKLTPASVTNTSVEPGLRPGTVRQKLPRIVGVRRGFGPTHHVGDLQILYHQKVIPPHQRAGLLVVKVLALISDLTMPRRDRLPPAATVLRGPLGTGQPLLPQPTGPPRHGPSADCRRAHRRWWWRN